MANTRKVQKGAVVRPFRISAERVRNRGVSRSVAIRVHGATIARRRRAVDWTVCSRAPLHVVASFRQSVPNRHAPLAVCRYAVLVELKYAGRELVSSRPKAIRRTYFASGGASTGRRS
jgi:hypothetical protein